MTTLCTEEELLAKLKTWKCTRTDQVCSDINNSYQLQQRLNPSKWYGLGLKREEWELLISQVVPTSFLLSLPSYVYFLTAPVSVHSQLCQRGFVGGSPSYYLTQTCLLGKYSNSCSGSLALNTSMSIVLTSLYYYLVYWNSDTYSTVQWPWIRLLDKEHTSGFSNSTYCKNSSILKTSVAKPCSHSK